MAKKEYIQNSAANESVSKYKLLSAYGGPGSLVHTQYGSIIISCIEQWGFLIRIVELNQKAVNSGKNEKETIQYVTDEARESENGNIGISNDHRLLESLQIRRQLPNLKYLVLIPDIEVVVHSNKIKSENSVLSPRMYLQH